jgi:hypothetical protein
MVFVPTERAPLALVVNINVAEQPVFPAMRSAAAMVKLTDVACCAATNGKNAIQMLAHMIQHCLPVIRILCLLLSSAPSEREALIYCTRAGTAALSAAQCGGAAAERENLLMFS